LAPAKDTSRNDLVHSAADVQKDDKPNAKTDEILSMRFGLDKSQMLMKTYQVSLKHKLSFFGTLYISKDYVCFYCKTFGYQQSVKIPLGSISVMWVKEERVFIIQQVNQTKYKFHFKVKEECWECRDIVSQLWTKRPLGSRTSSVGTIGTIGRSGNMVNSQSVENFVESSQVFKALPAEDWEQLLHGAKTVTVPKNTAIITQGEVYQRIYQINRGVCRIELQKEGNTIVLGSMIQDETFGEISFLNQGKGASASVIADQDETSLTIVEGYYINALFNVNPAFAGRFFRYLAVLLANRIKERQQKK